MVVLSSSSLLDLSPASIGSIATLKRISAYTSIRRKTAAIYFVRIAHVESMGRGPLITVNLIPLMDKVMALNGLLQLHLGQNKRHHGRVGEELQFEPLQKPEGSMSVEQRAYKLCCTVLVQCAYHPTSLPRNTSTSEPSPSSRNSFG